jgi:hypothetical protein
MASYDVARAISGRPYIIQELQRLRAALALGLALVQVVGVELLLERRR